MRKSCVQAVYLVGMIVGKLKDFVAMAVGLPYMPVHSTGFCTQFVAQFVLATVHKICSVFTPVNYLFMPTIHSTYNKQLRIT